MLHISEVKIEFEMYGRKISAFEAKRQEVKGTVVVTLGGYAWNSLFETDDICVEIFHSQKNYLPTD